MELLVAWGFTPLFPLVPNGSSLEVRLINVALPLLVEQHAESVEASWRSADSEGVLGFQKVILHYDPSVERLDVVGVVSLRRVGLPARA